MKYIRFFVFFSIPLCFLVLLIDRGNGQEPLKPKIAFSCGGNVCLIDPDGRNMVNLTHPLGGGDPVWSPDGKYIYFSSSRDVNVEIYRMDADGKNPINLARHPAHDGHPSVSPDGKQIVFSSNRTGGLYIMNTDGSNLHLLSPFGLRPDWSPDERQIAFYRFQDIWLIDADGKNLINLTNDKVGNFAPAWSPDGRQIAYGSFPPGDAVNVEEIYIMDSNGENKRRLTRAPGFDTEPAWSPNGKQIAFRSQRDNIPRIYLMNADGTNQRALTPPGIIGFEPSWFDPAFARSQAVEALEKSWTTWGFLKRQP